MLPALFLPRFPSTYPRFFSQIHHYVFQKIHKYITDCKFNDPFILYFPKNKTYAVTFSVYDILSIVSLLQVSDASSFQISVTSGHVFVLLFSNNISIGSSETYVNLIE